MDLTPTAWIWLAASVPGTLAVDWAALRLLLGVLRPPSAHVFWAARIAKVASVLAWCLFFNGYWHPQFVSAGAPLPGTVLAAEAAVIGVLLLLSVVTLPRVAWRGR